MHIFEARNKNEGETEGLQLSCMLQSNMCSWQQCKLHFSTSCPTLPKMHQKLITKMCLDIHFVILAANKYISEAARSNFSVFVRSVGTWLIVGRKSQFQKKPQRAKQHAKVRGQQRNQQIFDIFTAFLLQSLCTVKCSFPCALQRTSSLAFPENLKFLFIIVWKLQPSEISEKYYSDKNCIYLQLEMKMKEKWKDYGY